MSLTGAAGLSRRRSAKLFSVPALFWSLGASASETIFDAGLRRATVAQYTATYNARVAAYKQTVLTAFQQVEDYIATLRVTSQQIAREDAAVEAAQRYLDIAMARYETGLDPYLNVITAQTILLSDQQTQVHSAGERDDGGSSVDSGARGRMGLGATAHSTAGDAGRGPASIRRQDSIE